MILHRIRDGKILAHRPTPYLHRRRFDYDQLHNGYLLGRTHLIIYNQTTVTVHDLRTSREVATFSTGVTHQDGPAQPSLTEDGGALVVVDNRDGQRKIHHKPILIATSKLYLYAALETQASWGAVHTSVVRINPKTGKVLGQMRHFREDGLGQCEYQRM
ncbi:hypothetical protein HDV00_010706, partial [Rhizophlyctis rosea]